MHFSLFLFSILRTLQWHYLLSSGLMETIQFWLTIHCWLSCEIWHPFSVTTVKARIVWGKWFHLLSFVYRQTLDKVKSILSSSVEQQVKDLALSPQWLWLLLWYRFDLWPGNVTCQGFSQKKKSSFSRNIFTWLAIRMIFFFFLLRAWI